MTDYDSIYPKIPTAPPDEIYRLKKVEEIDKFLLDEIDKRDALAKRFKRRATAATISDTSVITAITALEVASIVTISTGVGLPLSIALASTGVILGFSSAIVHKVQKVFDSKAKKHDKIKTLAEAKRDSISGLVSKAIENGSISHEEYQTILNEAEHYRILKEQIRSKSKKVVAQITAEQREAILAQGREEAKQRFLQQIENTSATLTVSAT